MTLREIVVGETYYSRSWIPCQALDICRHGQDRSVSMVYYTNLVPTSEKGPWSISNRLKSSTAFTINLGVYQ